VSIDRTKLNHINLEIPGIDVKLGIATTGGNVDRYIQIIKAYYKSCSRLLSELRDCLINQDIELYIIHIHALKSSSDNIGAIEISKVAQALEFAGTKGDLDFIYAYNEQFVDDLKMVLDNIYAIIMEPTASGGNGKVIKETTKVRKKILIVDDTGAFLVLLNNILKYDYEIMLTKDGKDGLETARMAMPDLILLDVMMPGMTGYEVLTILKNDEAMKHIPVILISGKSSEKDQEKGYELGAMGYIKKPFEKEEVKDKVDAILK